MATCQSNLVGQLRTAPARRRWIQSSWLRPPKPRYGTDSRNLYRTFTTVE
ncbi:hypothetical protein Hanom_Chr09g00778301 [Helianthus anomalus]